eukprot:6173240-Pleurochrysis_carterae.AAC.5
MRKPWRKSSRYSSGTCAHAPRTPTRSCTQASSSSTGGLRGGGDGAMGRGGERLGPHVQSICSRDVRARRTRRGGAAQGQHGPPTLQLSL